MSTSVCLAEDDFTRERWLSEPRWVAKLSDGTEAISDDGRPGCVASAWNRLAHYVREKKLSLVRLSFQFRDHVELVVDAPGAKAFFFGRSVGASPGERPCHFWAAGAFGPGEGRAVVTKLLVPELLPWSAYPRSLKDCEHGLLWNAG